MRSRSLRESGRPRTWMRIGLPKNPYDSRRRFSRNRSYEKCSFASAFVNSTNVGGATLVCDAYITRTLRLPDVTGGDEVVIFSMKRLSSPVGTRVRAAAATLSTISSSFGVRSPVAAEM